MLYLYTNNKPYVHKTMPLGDYEIKVHLCSLYHSFTPGEVEALIVQANNVSAVGASYIQKAMVKVMDNHYAEHKRIKLAQSLSPSEFRDSFTPVELCLWSNGSWSLRLQSAEKALCGRFITVCFYDGLPSYTINSV